MSVGTLLPGLSVAVQPLVSRFPPLIKLLFSPWELALKFSDRTLCVQFQGSRDLAKSRRELQIHRGLQILGCPWSFWTPTYGMVVLTRSAYGLAKTQTPGPRAQDLQLNRPGGV